MTSELDEADAAQDRLDEVLTRIENVQQVTDQDIRDLKQEIFDDGVVSWREADRLFSLYKADIEKVADWDDFFNDTITDFLLRKSDPPGTVDKTMGSWFIARASEVGHIETETEYNILTNIVAASAELADNFVEFALEQVKIGLITGSGYMGRRRDLPVKRLGADDIEMIEKILYASGHGGHVTVTQKEAEILFDINDACTANEDVYADWQSLFVNAVTNNVMFHEADIDEDGSRKAPALSPQTVWDSFSGQDFEDQAERYLTGGTTFEIGSNVPEGEAIWLTRRIARDGVLSVHERVLLRHLSKMCPDIHPSLTPFIEAAA